MKLFLKQFHLRLAAIFWLLLVLSAALQAVLLHYVFTEIYREWEQRLNWDLAADLAHELQPFLDNDEQLKREMFSMMQINPKIGLYIVAENGEVRVALEDAAAEKTFVVPIAGIRRFFYPSAQRAAPLFTIHPEYPGEGPNRIFSAARITYRGAPAYLLVLLHNQKANSFLNGVRDFRLYVTAALTLAGGLAAMGLLGTILFYLVTARFRKIAKAVDNIAGGDLSARVEDKHSDEIALLAQGVNEMADAIATSIDRLEEKDRLRRDLVANVSHDLGSPIASLLAYLERLIQHETELTAADRRNCLNVAISDARALGRLVKDLLQLSKLEAKESAPNCEAFPIIDTITEEIIPRLKPLAGEQGVELSCQCPDSLPLVWADEALITRVLLNLTENAVVYSGAGSKVIVRLEVDGGAVQVNVSDNGSGISEEDLPRVFDRFFRADKSRRKGKGSGLGLAICKQIVEAHNSTLTVASVQGKGTTFSFSLCAAPQN